MFYVPAQFWVKLGCQNIAPVVIKESDSSNKRLGSGQVRHKAAPAKTHTRLFALLKKWSSISKPDKRHGNQWRGDLDKKFRRCIGLILVALVRWCANSVYLFRQHSVALPLTLTAGVYFLLWGMREAKWYPNLLCQMKRLVFKCLQNCNSKPRKESSLRYTSFAAWLKHLRKSWTVKNNK